MRVGRITISPSSSHKAREPPTQRRFLRCGASNLLLCGCHFHTMATLSTPYTTSLTTEMKIVIARTRRTRRTKIVVRIQANMMTTMIPGVIMATALAKTTRTMTMTTTQTTDAMVALTRLLWTLTLLQKITLQTHQDAARTELPQNCPWTMASHLKICHHQSHRRRDLHSV